VTVPIRPTETEQIRGTNALKQQSYSQQRAAGSGRQRPIRYKASGGIPSDADYTNLTMAPLGALVYYQPTHKLYVRDLPGVWLASPAFT
jgi:hypothetical protein